MTVQCILRKTTWHVVQQMEEMEKHGATYSPLAMRLKNKRWRYYHGYTNKKHRWITRRFKETAAIKSALIDAMFYSISHNNNNAPF